MRDRPARDDEQGLEAAAAAMRLPPSRVRYFVRIGLVRPSRVEGRVPFFGQAELAQLPGPAPPRRSRPEHGGHRGCAEAD